MRRFLNERNIYLLLSLVIATTLWLYVTTARSPRVDRATAKAVSVVPTIVGEPAYGYSLLSVGVIPPTVSITGEPRLLEPVETVTTEPVNISNAMRDISQDVSVVTPPGIEVGARVRVSIRIAPAFVQTVLRGVRVQVLGAPSGVAVDLQPASVQVRVSGPAVLVTRLRAEDFTATVDAAGLAVGQHQLSVKVRGPAQMEVLGVQPAQIVVTVRRGG